MRLKPFIQHCVVAGLFMLPAPSWAVGLGRLTLQSGLGQALSAEIELTSVQPGELDTLTARLADQAAYSSNKIDYGAALARVRVVLDRRDGRPVLKVSSTQPINEPFLDLLIELSWATGRLMREYTFLLDPPGFVATTTAVEPTAAIPAQIVSSAVPGGPAPAAGTPAAAGASPAASAPSAASAPAAAAYATAAATPGPQAAGAETYGPVKRGDTLGKIAARLKPEGVTLEQMLAALYRANAKAFDGKNMNRLRTGPILTVPTAAAVAAVPNVEAKKEIRLQAADWRAYRDRLAGAAASSGEARSSRQTAGGRITTALADRAAVASGADKLRLSKGETLPGAGGVAARAENSLAAQKTAAEANSRVADLEKQVKDLARLLELKNSSLQAQQLAAEQSRAAAKGAPASASPGAAPAPAVSEKTVSAAPAALVQAPADSVAPSTATTQAGEMAKAEATKAQAVAPVIAAKTSPPPSDTKGADAVAAPVPATKDTLKAKTILRPAQTVQEPSLWDDLLSNTLVLVGVPTAILLGVLYWVLARRRRGTAAKFEDSIGAGTDIRTSTVFGNTGGGVVNTGDNSMVSDFSREGLGNIDTGEVDPIAEAEVYLAYGRDNQAEEILRDALAKNPDRQEIRLKLLEIYAQQDKPTAFETIASELFAATKGAGDVWAKAAQLGRGIDPANPLYAAKTEAGGGAGAAASAAQTAALSPDHARPDSTLDVAAAVEKSASETDFKVPEARRTEVFVMPPDLMPPEPVRALAVPQSSSLSTPLAAAAAASVAAATAARAGAIHEHAPLDFKLDDVPDGTGQTPSPAADFVTLDGPITLTGANTLSGPSTFAGVTLAPPSAQTWGEKLLAPPPVKPSVAPPPRGDKQPDLNLVETGEPPAMSGSAPGAVASAGPSPAASGPTRAPQPSGTLDLDKLDLSFDAARQPFEDPTPSVLDGQWHDAATKLDLAKAYQEMGDVEAAREILQEVMAEGDEQQKKEAQTFLAKLRG